MERYKPCPICGGNMDFRQEPSDNNDNDEMIDVFECQDCKTTLYSDGNSDLLYDYFYNGEPEDQEVTIKMPYKDLTNILIVLGEWMNDIKDSEDISPKKVNELYYNLFNVWGENALHG